MRPLVEVLVGIALVVLAGGAHAADPALPPPAMGQPVPPPPPAWGPPGQPPPPAWGQPLQPPPPGYSPYGMPYAYPAGPGGAAFYYEAQKKNELLALVVEFLIPGIGSIYADHVAGALITWGLTIGGVILAFWWVGQNIDQEDSFGNGNNGPNNVWAIYVAVGAILGGRIYGLVDSYTSARDYNQRLRQRMGLPEWASVGVVPIRTDRTVSWGPSLSVRF